LSSGYGSKIGGLANTLPGPAKEAVKGSLAGALGTAGQLRQTGNAAQAQQLVDAAKDAWAHGLQLSLMIGAGIVLVAAALCAKFLPGRESPELLVDETEQLDGEMVLLGSPS